MKKRILIVDDDPQIGEIFALKLKLHDYDSEFTTAGAKAVELVRTGRFDLMFLDMVMPGLSGADVFHAVRTFSQIPIIIFTARPDIFDTLKRLGISDYLSKPIHPDRMMEKIEAALSGKTEPAPLDAERNLGLEQA